MTNAKLTDFQKGQIVAYDDCGLSGRQIAVKIGKSQQAIAEFLKNFKATGNYNRKTGSGRKKQTTNIDDQNILETAKKDRTISAKQIKRELKLPVSPQTIRNRLHAAGYYSHFKVKKPFVSAVNQQRRLNWAKKYIGWSVGQWKKVIWLDESQFVFRFN